MFAHLLHSVQVQLGVLGFSLGVILHTRLPWKSLTRGHNLRGERANLLGDLRQRQHELHGAVIDGARGHGWKERVGGILGDADTAAASDRQQPRGAVVEIAGEDDADHAWSVRHGGTPEHRIHGGTVSVFSRPAHEVDAAVEDDEVPIGWRDVDASGLDRGAGLRMCGGQRARALENFRENARAVHGEMHRDEHGAGKIRRQPAHDARNSFDAAGGGPDHDDGNVCGHVWCCGRKDSGRSWTGTARMPSKSRAPIVYARLRTDRSRLNPCVVR